MKNITTKTAVDVNDEYAGRIGLADTPEGRVGGDGVGAGGVLALAGGAAGGGDFGGAKDFGSPLGALELLGAPGADRFAASAAISAAEAETLEITPAQRKAIELLTAGHTLVAAARAVGVNRSTVYRWFKNDAAFVSAYNAWQRDVVETARRRLLAVGELATSVVVKAMLRGDVVTAREVLKCIGAFEKQRLGAVDQEQVARQLRVEEAKSEVLLLRAEQSAAELEEGGMIEGRAGKREFVRGSFRIAKSCMYCGSTSAEICVGASVRLLLAYGKKGDRRKIRRQSSACRAGAAIGSARYPRRLLRSSASSIERRRSRTARQAARCLCGPDLHRSAIESDDEPSFKDEEFVQKM